MNLRREDKKRLPSRNPQLLAAPSCANVYLDERPAGWMQNFSAGEKTTWAATGHTLTKEQLEAQRAEMARKREERQRLILEQQ